MGGHADPDPALRGRVPGTLQCAHFLDAGQGTQGTFVARDLDCHKGCAWFGDFASANRTLVLRDVRLADVSEPPDLKAGTAIAVVDISSVLYHGVVYPRQVSTRAILAPSVLVALLLGLLPVILFLSWLWAVPIRYWRRKAVQR